jgi:SagB-type dehydrogenase family enzyme
MNELITNDSGACPVEDFLWELFHENSKIGRYDSLLNSPGDHWARREAADAADFRQYPLIPLPVVSPPVSLTVPNPAFQSNEQAQASKSFTVSQLATLLAGACELASRAATARWDLVGPSPQRQGLPPALRLFAHCMHIEGLGAGLYYYDTRALHLRLLNPGGHSGRIGGAVLDTNLALEAELLLFLTARLTPADLPHGNRDYRLLLLDAGRLAQSFHLVAQSLDLHCIQLGYYFDREIDGWLDLDGISQSTLVILAIGTRPYAVGGSPQD